MKFQPHRLWAGLALICMLSACKSPPPRTESSASPSTRNNCYSLLHQVLDEEKDVSWLRFIKHENTDLKNLINRVAMVAGDGAAQLEKFAKQDPALTLDDIRLPPGEIKTRDFVGAMKEKELLHASGNQFELALILSQIEALNYASSLAKMAGENDAQPERARYAAHLAAELGNLRDEVTTRLTVRP